jgi:sigma-B regulation protein RsbU (phosphoserine phosphatase)
MTLVGMVGVLYMAASAILLGSIRDAEKREAQQSVKGVLSLLEQTQEDFGVRFADWSAWDEAYTFVQDANKDYLEVNLVPEVLANLKVNVMLFINTSGRIVYGTGFDLNNKAYKPVPEQLRVRLSPNDLLLQHASLTSKHTGILLLPEGPMLITSQPIVTSKVEGPIRGTLIVSRNLDAIAIERLAKIARLPLTLYRVDDTQMPADFQVMRSALSKTNSILVRPLNERAIGGYTLLNDIYSKPALILRVDIPRETYQRGQQSLHYLIISLLVAGLVFGGVTLLLLERLVLSRLARLNADVRHIGLSSDPSMRVHMAGTDELLMLANAINGMLEALEQFQKEVTTLNQRLKADNLRMSAELEVTRQLQKMILPKEEELSRVKGLEIAGFMEPAQEVGGDYYDVLYHNGAVKIGIGDVTGHGLESGVLMIMVQTAVRTLLTNNETDPVQFLNVLNRTIYGNVQRMNSDKNLTLSLLDYQDGILRLSGQHEEIIVVRSGGKVERIDTIDLGFPIGLEADIAKFVAQTQVSLAPGDVVVLYTDGITEAENSEGMQYGLERLCEVVSHNWQRSSLEIRQAVIEDVRQYIGEQKVYDDITLVILKHK